jgi:sphinganine-1-phosphate aldolase
MLFALKFPPARNKVQTEMAKVRKDLEDKLAPRGSSFSRHVALPIEGHSAEWIEAEMSKMDGEQRAVDWKDGRCSGAVYRKFSDEQVQQLTHPGADGGDDLEKVLVSAFARYTVSNPLHPDVFPCKLFTFSNSLQHLLIGL